MAGKPKNRVDYFPHLVGGYSDGVMPILRHKFGNDGYAIYYMLCEVLGRTEGHYLDLSENVKFALHAVDFKVDESKLDEFLSYLASSKVINPELWNQRIVWMPSFVDSLSKVYEHRGRQLPSPPILDTFDNDADIIPDMPNNGTGKPKDAPDIPQSIGKQSIVKDSSRGKVPAISAAEYKKSVNKYFDKIGKESEIYKDFKGAYELIDVGYEIERAKRHLLRDVSLPKRRGGKAANFYRFLDAWLARSDKEAHDNMKPKEEDLPVGVPIFAKFLIQVKRYADVGPQGSYNPKLMDEFTTKVFNQLFGGIETYTTTASSYLNNALRKSYDEGVALRRESLKGVDNG